MPTPDPRSLDFVARTSRVRASADDDAAARALAASGFDWERVLRLCEHHGVSALVDESLTRLRLGEAPAEFRQRLRQVRLAGASADMLRYGHWLDLCRAFEAAGIVAVTLKGFHAVLALYGRVGMRAVGDLDFLVDRRDVPAALRLLRDAGYSLHAEWEAAWQHVGLEYVLDHAKEMPLIGKNGIVVDLHWGAGHPGTTDSTASIIAGAERIEAEGMSLRVSAKDVAASLYITHGHSSQWSRLRWLVDVAESLEACSAEEFARVEQRLARLGMEPALASALHHISAFWGRLPACVSERARGLRVSPALLAHHRRVLERESDTNRLEHHLGPVRALRDLVQRTESLSAAVATAMRPSARDWAVLPLPEPLRVGYYLVRPLRVLRHLVIRRRNGYLRPSTTDTVAVPEVRHRAALPASPLTLVTAIYANDAQTLVGGRGRDLAEYLPSLINISRLGAALVVYCPPQRAAAIEQALRPHFARLMVMPYELSRFELYDEVMEFKRTYRDKLNVNDRNEVLCFQKAYWLQEVAQRNPWSHTHFYWIDAGLTHHGIFPERVGGVELRVVQKASHYYPENDANIFRPALATALMAATPEGKMLACALPWRGAASQYERAASAMYGLPDGALKIGLHVVGGIFGGRRDDIEAVHKEYVALLRHFISERVYTLEEQVLSTVQARHPERFALQQFATWWFYSPGERTSYLDREADSFYKIFARWAAELPSQVEAESVC